MARRSVGSRGDVMVRGNLVYVDSPANSTQYALLADTARISGTGTDGSAPAAVSILDNGSSTLYAALADTARVIGASAPAIISTKEELIFYPGASAITDGMVLSGSRTSAGTITTGATANQTYWGPESICAPLVRGKIDGVSTGGILSGQITMGLKTGAGTADAKVTARIRNNSSASSADAGAWVTCLTLSAATIACTTAEIFKTYDMPRLKTTGTINSVPYGVAIGVQWSAGTAAASIIGRIMESSYIQGWVEPGT